ncbi:marine proteobacterial sortase target protein [Desulfopila inferna]|uniref:marine proteobacterial sortase target protein n=1 Tax=Desulfopila inferna TaxID=468528 RepID=UPI0019633474|nr:marine proteobacterial sortase target protein [Desulfopila inferna]MBM9604061.1 marine proteobacterial sortase target protein [Desulfopila inferna]
MKNRADIYHGKNDPVKTGDPGNLLIVIYIMIIAFFLLLGSFSQASAETGTTGEEADLNDVRRGELFIAAEQHDETAIFSKAPVLEYEVKISISGMVANAFVRQRFINDSDQWRQAVYVFPLPDESAVQHMRMIVGDRVIVGKIEEKREARRIYEKARSEGKKTSLLAQKRPNVFSMAVANIPPNGVVEVEIEFLDAVHFDNDVFSYRFPLVVGPRYIPGKPLANSQQNISFDGGGWSADSNEVGDASEITPPVAVPSEPAVNPVELSLSLAPGFPLRGLTSLYHGTRTKILDDGTYSMSFDGRVYADRDFVIEYRADAGSEISASLFTESVSDDNYGYLMITPPSVILENPLPREVMFVLDISGSMAGSSIRQAKRALQLAISRLRRLDRFNVVVFNDSARTFYPEPLRATAENRSRALGQLAGLEASGGTEIASALKLALDGRDDHGRIRQVIFLTDGAVANEETLFAYITRRLGDSRLFTVGIGSAPNSYFMTRAAAVGRGSYSFIGNVDEVGEKMTTLFKKLENPVITGIKLESVAGGEMEVYPQPLPDLYSGEPLRLLLKTSQALGPLRLSGTQLGKPWDINISGRGEMRPGIAALWARKKIRGLIDTLHHGADENTVRREVIDIAVKHHLVSRYTSLVAVEEEVSRPRDRDLESSTMKTNLPQGWQYTKVFGGVANTATRSSLAIMLGIIVLAIGTLVIQLSRRRYS